MLELVEILEVVHSLHNHAQDEVGGIARNEAVHVFFFFFKRKKKLLTPFSPPKLLVHSRIPSFEASVCYIWH
jgi:hypothetical protein